MSSVIGTSECVVSQGETKRDLHAHLFLFHVMQYQSLQWICHSSVNELCHVIPVNELCHRERVMKCVAEINASCHIHSRVM